MPTAVDSIAREHVESFLEDLDERFKPATLGARFRSLQQLFKWMLEEGEVTSNPIERMRAPSVPEDPPTVRSDAKLRALLKACEGSDFVARRDTAILRTFIDTGPARGDRQPDNLRTSISTTRRSPSSARARACACSRSAPTP